MASLPGFVQAPSSSAVRGEGFNGWGIYRLLYCGANVSQLMQDAPCMTEGGKQPDISFLHSVLLPSFLRLTEQFSS